jgi:hypothetical protein
MYDRPRRRRTPVSRSGRAGRLWSGMEPRISPKSLRTLCEVLEPAEIEFYEVGFRVRE